MATHDPQACYRPAHILQPAESSIRQEELLETVSADSDASIDEGGMSEHTQVQGMLRRADWLHEQSDRQVRVL
jgi:hypothetical protein